MPTRGFVSETQQRGANAFKKDVELFDDFFDDFWFEIFNRARVLEGCSGSAEMKKTPEVASPGVRGF